MVAFHDPKDDLPPAPEPSHDLIIYVIYLNNAVIPRYACRRWYATKSGPDPIPEPGFFAVADNLEGLRDKLPEGLTLVPRFPGEAPEIVETWM